MTVLQVEQSLKASEILKDHSRSGRPQGMSQELIKMALKTTHARKSVTNKTGTEEKIQSLLCSE